MAQEWLRLYRRTVNNAKLQRLGLEAIGFWTNCLCLSDDEGYLPDVGDIAWSMRVTETLAETFLVTLQCNNLIVREGDGRLRLHDWDEHQKRSDSSADRVRKYREKRQKDAQHADVTACNVTVTAQSREDTDTEKNREERLEAREQVRDDPKPNSTQVSKASSKTKGNRWPADAVVPDEWLDEAEASRELARLPPADLRAEAMKFAHYWSSKSGAGATKLDWKRTWLVWCLKANGVRNGSGFGAKSQLEQLAEIVARERTGTVIDG